VKKCQNEYNPAQNTYFGREAEREYLENTYFEVVCAYSPDLGACVAVYSNMPDDLGIKNHNKQQKKKREK
jgi:hypothetical protein